jgi:hypothetical protein
MNAHGHTIIEDLWGISFYMWAISHKRKVDDYFFPVVLVVF